MVNIMITYDCNRNCHYCFAKGQREKFPEKMSMEKFLKLIKWLEKENIHHVILMGGEPTLHPKLRDFLTILKKRDFKIDLFTNGIFDYKLIKYLEESVDRFLINYNPPFMYKVNEKKVLEKNLKKLSEIRNDWISLGCTIFKPKFDFQHLIHACEEYDIPNIRFGTATPNSEKNNIFINKNQLMELGSDIIKLTRLCVRLNIKLSLDHCLPYCIFTKKERLFIEKTVQRKVGICGFPYDINPDLSAYACLPLPFKIKDITSFSIGEIRNYFNNREKKLRWEKDTFEKCEYCTYKIRKLCQGGCLGYKL